jgi:hypothetical protein
MADATKAEAAKSEAAESEAAKQAAVHSAEPAHTPREVVAAAAEELHYTERFLIKHGWRLLPVFIGLLVPALLFAALVEEYREDGIFFFDKPVLLWLHAHATPLRDDIAVVLSDRRPPAFSSGAIWSPGLG